MGYLQAAVLGALQGFTEFLPISSSAHLVIARWVLGWGKQDLVVDTALHAGTLLALVVYFWRDWVDIVRADLLGRRKPSEELPSEVPSGPSEDVQAAGNGSGVRKPSRSVPIGMRKPGSSPILLPLIAACIPAALAGALLEDQAETIFRSPWVVAVTLAGFGLLLLAADRLGRKARGFSELRLMDWVVIGIAQAVAIVPGVSRSGITITAGLLRGLEREAAARVSFMLGTPVIFGAAVYEARHLVSAGIPAEGLVALGVGVLASAVVGYLCIAFLLGYLRKRGVGLFVWYRIALAAVLVVCHVVYRLG